MLKRLVTTFEHDTVIHSLALSRDETRLACGGADAPITIWNVSDGMLLTRLTGLKHQAHAVAFSPDDAWLAAVNVWGGLYVWQLADGQLIEQKPETKSRRNRSLVYPATSKNPRLPVMLTHSIYSQPDRSLAPDGKSLAVVEGARVKVLKYRTTTELSTINLSKYGIFKQGVGKLVWSTDSKMLAMGGRGWAGVWMPFEHPPSFYGVSLPASIAFDEKVVLSSRQILYPKGRSIGVLELPETPLLTEWERFLNSVPEPESGFKAKNDWQWNETQSGYDGVHTFEAQLVWYNHNHNPHAGGGAAEQSFTSFLEDGPYIRDVPNPILVKVCQAVRQLIG